MLNSHRRFAGLALALALALLAWPTLAQEAVLATNLREECVSAYDPNVDYFPEKVTITDAVNFSVEYHNNYKVVTVTNAFNGADPFTYVLVQCGTPAPDADDFPAGTQFIEVSAGSIIAMSTTQLPHLTELGLVDKLVGLDSFLYVNSPQVRELIKNGKLVEVGSGAEVNVELVLETDPDIVMTFGFNPTSDAHPVLIEAGVFTALNAEWRERTPLGRAEWIKYTALFYNQEAKAEEIYSKIVEAYEEAKRLAADVPEDERVTVLWNTYSSFSESWSIPGAQTYVGALISDAGGVIALGDQAMQGNASLSFEAVYNDALDADVWITGSFGVTTLDDLLARDSRYADFTAVKNNNVWNNTRDLNENGGNNYWELGVTNPHLILRDLVAIFYPELLPDHEFSFYLRLEPKPRS